MVEFIPHLAGMSLDRPLPTLPADENLTPGALDSAFAGVSVPLSLSMILAPLLILIQSLAGFVRDITKTFGHISGGPAVTQVLLQQTFVNLAVTVRLLPVTPTYVFLLI